MHFLRSHVLAEALFLGVALPLGLCVISGFPKEQCDEMDPTQVAFEGGESPGKEYPDYNSSSEVVSEEPMPTSVQLSTRFNLFRIVPSSPKYRRGRVMDITIRGEFNALMLQVRKIGPDERRGHDPPDRVGEFQSWPATLQPVMCDKGKATALTNKNFVLKKDITVKWKAPNEDIGDIHVVGRFVTGDEYWPISESREIPMSEFPVNLANCGKAKSCILYSESTKSCHEDNCDYILTYSVVNNTNVEFVLGGKAKGENSYLAVGFSKTKEAEVMKLVACTRSKTAADIKYFVLLKQEEGLMEQPLNLENHKMDLDGDRLWCSFTMSMVNHPDDENGLDLSIPMYQVYMRGETNNTKTANVPILPSKLLVSKKEMLVEKIKLQYHMMEKPKGSGSSADIIRQPGFFLLAILIFFSFSQH